MLPNQMTQAAAAPSFFHNPGYIYGKQDFDPNSPEVIAMINSPAFLKHAQVQYIDGEPMIPLKIQNGQILP